MKNYPYCLFIFLIACRPAPPPEADATADPRTPVKITHIMHHDMSDYIELNATSSFLLKSYVKANANGYLRSGTIRLGQSVNAGQQLFTVKTKEAESIGNAVNALDSTFRFSGTNSIRASGKGYITQLNHVEGDYVQDGEQLAVISDQNSFVFLLDMPYELKPSLSGKKSVEVILPDGEKLQGSIASSMPVVDAAAQTQTIVIKVSTPHPIPENLVAKVRIPGTTKNNTVTVPVAAVLTDETQSEFWIMKITDDSTAIKVPVTKGIQNSDQIEILSPPFSDSDKIIIIGNYGLEDTAKIKIVN
ncbi:MAG: efflux RND transporter periplasmic adaptor subunit [Chitinophagaceae bacterium]|nr:efflux RND transporter periplasmic adaptor subunit [Chitinophagaceae bacterium]